MIPVDKAVEEFRISRATVFKFLREGRLHRWRKPADRQTYIDRNELRRLLKPRVVKG